MKNENILQELDKILQQRKKADKNSSYVASLYAKGEDAILKKIAEEAAETIMAAKDKNKEHIIYETADLWFHSMILLADRNIKTTEVLAELQRRFGTSGIDEKAMRTK